jgi:diadenylate cyclase
VDFIGALSDFTSFFRWWDVFDILIVALVIYQVLLLIKGTQTLQIIIGLIFLFVVYWIASQFEMRTLQSMFGNIFDNFLIILILLFHAEIRRGLSSVGRAPFFKSSEKSAETKTIEELVKSCVSFSNKKIGVLVVVERQANVLDFIEAGTMIDSQLSRDVLTSIFMPVSPLHDGAVLVRRGRVHMARCFLPLTINPNVSKAVGTRHRAAIGLTEETDALCIIVSEENGTISLAQEGKIMHNLDQAQLRKRLLLAL